MLSVVSFRTGGFDAIFTWEESSGYGYWGLWVRQLGSMIMMFPVLLVPIVGLIQAIRYVRSGEGDLYDVSHWRTGDAMAYEKAARPGPVHTTLLGGLYL